LVTQQLHRPLLVLPRPLPLLLLLPQFPGKAERCLQAAHQQVRLLLTCPCLPHSRLLCLQPPPLHCQASCWRRRLLPLSSPPSPPLHRPARQAGVLRSCQRRGQGG
jgi:hypothetical protein